MGACSLLHGQISRTQDLISRSGTRGGERHHKGKRGGRLLPGFAHMACCFMSVGIVALFENMGCMCGAALPAVVYSLLHFR